MHSSKPEGWTEKICNKVFGKQGSLYSLYEQTQLHKCIKKLRTNVLNVIKTGRNSSSALSLFIDSLNYQNNSRKDTKGFGYIRCSWGQPDIHRAAYSNIQGQTCGREREGQSMQSERKRREGKRHVSTCEERGRRRRRGTCRIQHICKLCNNTGTATVWE